MKKYTEINYLKTFEIVVLTEKLKIKISPLNIKNECGKESFEWQVMSVISFIFNINSVDLKKSACVTRQITVLYKVENYSYSLLPLLIVIYCLDSRDHRIHYISS